MVMYIDDDGRFYIVMKNFSEYVVPAILIEKATAEAKRKGSSQNFCIAYQDVAQGTESYFAFKSESIWRADDGLFLVDQDGVVEQKSIQRDGQIIRECVRCLGPYGKDEEDKAREELQQAKLEENGEKLTLEVTFLGDEEALITALSMIRGVSYVRKL